MFTRTLVALALCVTLAACGIGESVTSTAAITEQTAKSAPAAGLSKRGDDTTASSTEQATMLSLFENSSGSNRTVSTSTDLVSDNPFFKSVGSNGRACVTCHQPALNWSITPEFVKERFDDTQGTDALFRLIDGANSPNADVSTARARRHAYSMLLNKGLIRVGLPIPSGAEFTLEALDDPYGFASVTELSLFRRPLPTTNLRFLSAVMWDGRESVPKQALHDNLARQSNDATRGHAQSARDLTPLEVAQIVTLETSLASAQVSDETAGSLTSADARGGPKALAAQEFFIGINDPLGNNSSGAAFDPNAFRLFDGWANLVGDDEQTKARRAIARGQALFNSKPIRIVGVKGLNDELSQASISGTCTTCHDSPNVGNHSVAAPLDIGLTDASRRTADMPLYTLRCTATGDLVQTTDPGRALVTGKCKDIGRFKGPVLRGLAARPPYFHNGFASDLNAAVNFYNTRFNIGMSDHDMSDLVAFLKAL